MESKIFFRKSSIYATTISMAIVAPSHILKINDLHISMFIILVDQLF